MSQTRFQCHVSSPMHCFDPSILRSEACGSIEGSDLVRRGIGGEPHEGEKDFQEAREIWEIGKSELHPLHLHHALLGRRGQWEERG